MVVPHVVLAGPLQLHRAPHLAGDPCRLDHEVIGQLAAETAADTGKVDVYPVLGDAERARDQRAAPLWVLCRRPELHSAAFVIQRRAILRLHVGMRNEGIVIAGLDNGVGLLEGGFDIAVAALDVTGLPRQFRGAGIE